MTSIKIVLTTILLGVSYGIVHDLITAHVCIEYFTIGHPEIIKTDSPILLALIWGIIATWWFSLILGIVLASFNYFSEKPSLGLKEICKMIVNLLFVMMIIAMLAGVIGYLLAEKDVIYLVSDLALKIDDSKHSLFLFAGWAHISSYLGGIVGTVLLSRKILLKRKQMA